MSKDFWKGLTEGHMHRCASSSLDGFLSGQSKGESFESVRGLTDAGRAAKALPLPVAEGTQVVFAGHLGAYLSYENTPENGATGVVVSVRSASGETTSHDGMVFVKWANGQFMAVHAEHLRLAGVVRTAAPKALNPHSEKYTFETFRDRYFEDDPDVEESIAREFWYDFRFNFKGDLRAYLEENKDEGTYRLAFIRRRIRVASLGDLSSFLKTADGKLIHKSTNDLWALRKDADGGFVVERLTNKDLLKDG